METMLKCRKCGGGVIVETRKKLKKSGAAGKRDESQLVCKKCGKKY